MAQVEIPRRWLRDRTTGARSRWSRRPGIVGIAAALGLAALVPSCSDGGSDEPAAPATTEPRGNGSVGGPAADLSEELAGGAGVFIGSPDAIGDDGSYQHRFDEPGYVEEEFAADGEATSYVVDGELTDDGRWRLEEDQTADYRTRALVRRPTDADDFSGVVVVEWFNVSGGADADPEWTSVGDEILREGHAWVGVSAQAIGIEGGPVLVELDVPGSETAGQGLVAIDPERYGSLEHPGDAFSFDMFTQIARALRAGDGLGGLEPTALVAAGESQSAAALVTYVNGVQPLTHAFDGFFVHSRGASGLPIPAPGESVDIAGTIGRTPTTFRIDTDAPVFNLQAEGDLTSFLGSVQARQDDTDKIRLWELAGSPHADAHLVGERTVDLVDCGIPVNDGPMHLVAKAGLHHLVAWVTEGAPPPETPRIELTDEPEPQIRRDEDGIALGGVRPPPVEIPVKVLSSESAPGSDMFCVMLGSAEPLPPERLAVLYASPEDYEEQYAAAVDDAIDTGTILDADRDEIEAYADPSSIPG